MSNCTSLASWPACTLECGLFIDDQRVPALTQQLLDQEHILANFQSYFDLPVTKIADSGEQFLAFGMALSMH